MRQIIIEIDGPEGKFNVREGEKHTGGVNWDEMLSQVASMTIPDFIVWRGTYPMLTDAEWEARKVRLTEPL
ncbi:MULTISPECIES: hypothetical protein [unclassified Herbaspirillum]|uniref:hypothetical protein n=1 Tax=unclassified Herbaspirillum TaxID=2624150 RepID=UPI000C0AD52D|nr:MULTISPECIES: hypothetical protein [unclassified Herbaspirillum]MAF04927.1 hypothetical protein [Herbaspirillum sp.]MBO18475.1 hypothetical protein [Herbaspirillum sp.]|tara:strand:+ start:2670 stop:2882 length:213 start_codon:yes stop_codon:yes gene_type:complete